MDDWDKAGKIAGDALLVGKKLIKPGARFIEVTEAIENKINELGGKVGFPIQISVNNIAAHYTCIYEDKSVFNEEDIVKLDMGASCEGAVGDTAVTVDLSGKNKDLCKASYSALLEAIKMAKPGVPVCSIGEAVGETIASFGFKPITNLSGHGLNRWIVHDKPTIPNYNNGDKTKLKEGQIIAIEPFATDGCGLVAEGVRSFNYKLVKVKPVRNSYARDLMKYISDNFRTLPFSQRWLYTRFNKLEVNVGMNALLREGVIQNYAVLPEKNKGMVSQFEHTIRVGDKVLTRVEGSH
ncbi:type II methionyl aminopeptidase [Candidatus Pacearchaeota archaeon]|nr:type II methionyl aminopeptidase [Candidatus Pacearchaeota archaeon]